jgi:leucyl aminopeptidase
VRPGDIVALALGQNDRGHCNTDAKGRVILADAITYAKRYDPKIVVDVATLTGAALVALANKQALL